MVSKFLYSPGWLLARLIFYFVMTTEDITWSNIISFSVGNKQLITFFESFPNTVNELWKVDETHCGKNVAPEILHSMQGWAVVERVTVRMWYITGCNRMKLPYVLIWPVLAAQFDECLAVLVQWEHENTSRTWVQQLQYKQSIISMIGKMIYTLHTENTLEINTLCNTGYATSHLLL